MRTAHTKKIAMGTATAIVCWSVLFTGCDGTPSKVAISGTITCDGEPIADGQVAFEPRGEGRMQFGVITDGKYRIPQEYGLVPGTYLVRITGNRPTGKMAQPDSFLTEGRSLEIQEQFIPAKYNTASELEVEIPAEPEVVRDFSLPSKK